MTELHALVFGRVQLVMFRDFTQRTARRLGIKGFVLNRADGSVEVVAQADMPVLDEFLKELNNGSFLSRVDLVESEWRVPEKKYEDFKIVY